QLSGPAHAAGLSLPATPDAFKKWLSSRLASKLGIDPSCLNPTRPIIQYGIDSLAAIELAHDIESVFKVDLPLVRFLQGWSMDQLAGECATQLDAAVSSEAVTGPRRSAAQYPLSRGQSGLWFLCHMNPDSSAYSIVRAVRIPVALDIPALERAFQTLVDRHECLRTSFIAQGDEPIQSVSPRSKVHFQAEDLSGCSEDEFEASLADKAREAACSFDLASGPLFRVYLLTRSIEEHVMVLAVHHIIADLWSLALLIEELGIAYSAEKLGIAPSFHPGKRDYGHYVSWQAELLSSARGEDLWSYWQRQLTDHPPILNLLTDRPRPPVQTYNGGSISFRLSADQTAELRNLSRHYSATLYVTLLAAFQTLLYRYTSQETILVGSPTAGRPSADFDRVVGYFVNPVSLITTFLSEMTFDQLVVQVRDTAVSALDHQDYPFSTLVDRLRLQRDPSRSPLFQVMFVFQGSSLFGELGPFALGEAGARIDLPDLVLESVALEQRFAQYDLTLAIAEVQDTMTASLEYNAGLFDPDTIARMSSHFLSLLNGIPPGHARPLTHLPLLADSERHQVLLQARSPYSEQAPSRSIHGLFETQVERSPDSIAVVFERQQLSYRELNSRANSLARYMQARGVGPETLVGVCTERSAELVLCLLSILKAGAAFVPLDPTYPKLRLAYVLEDSHMSVLLTESRFLFNFPDIRAASICIDRDWDAIRGMDGQNLPAITVPDNTAYVIYTSGSTGAPKGVLVTHLNVVRLFQATNDWFHFNDQDTWTLYHSYAFDFSVWELWGALLAGARVIVVPYWVSRSPDLFLEMLSVEAVTILNQTPSGFAQLVQADGSHASPMDLGLRAIVFGGEALDLQTLRPWFERHGDNRPVLINMYGITETTVHVTYRQLSRTDLCKAPMSVIGEPIPDLGVYVLDGELQPAPLGIPGQVYVSGPGLARGYLGQGDLTASRFLPDPFSTREGMRMYASGDLGRYSAERDLQYLGRVDHQVKIRGFRIELGEIESILEEHAAVARAVVMMRQDAGSEKQLAAYIVPRPGTEPAPTELRDFLKRRLPEYMVPSAFVTLESLPLTSNGKLDRGALPSPDRRSAMGARTFQAPRTAVEKTLTTIWGDVLRIKDVGVFDNFFELGGDSIISIQAVSRARQRGLALTPRLLFEHQTVADLAACLALMPPLESGRERTAAITAAPTPPQQWLDLARESDDGIEDAYPLSPMQQGMLFHTLYAPESGVYCTQLLCDLDGELDPDALEQAWQSVLIRHDSLRAGFEWESVDNAIQVIRSHAKLTLHQTDWLGLSPRDRQVRLDQYLAEDRKRGFELNKPPLMRLLLIRIGPDKFSVLWSSHHLLLDGWSIPMILEEVFDCYDAYHAGRNPVISQRRPFKDYILWQQAQDSRAAESFWRTTLRGLTAPTSLRTNRASCIHAEEGYLEDQRLVTEYTTAALGSLARSHQLTLNTLVQGAWALLMSKYSGDDNVVFGTVLSGRPAELEGVDSMIGLFINTLPVRVKIHHDQPLLSWLTGLQNQFADLRQYEYSSLAQVRNWSDVPPGTPLFEAIVVLENYPLDPSLMQRAADLKISNVRPVEQTNYPLTVTVLPGAELGLLISYDREQFDPGTIAQMLGHLSNLLEGMASRSDCRLFELQALAEPRMHHLLAIWNDTGTELEDTSIGALFEQRARSVPDSVAIVAGQELLTYGDLDRWANRLAHYIRSLGVVTGSTVGICLPRSGELVVALLGLLKAGACYVPLDPEYPASRLSFMLEDSGAVMLLAAKSLPAGLEGTAKAVYLDSEWEIVARNSDDTPAGCVGAGDLAYVIYTSGSTGRAKGVMVNHRAVCNHLQWMGAEFPLLGHDRMLQKYSISFDTAVMEILYPLVSGATLVITKPEGQSDLDYLFGTIQDEGVTAIDVVPAMLNALVSDGRIKSCKTLRRITCGGDVLTEEL
ncbi:MAG TPA: amino acid adenylation domain-containing protein, partial [Blastocatellia bacterium]|nr:amino acid adenylation domain-containing protein [Blastocatellia bacterium]